MADDAIFRIYSMTKPIASVALMQLYERGMFQLLDPVHRYIPEWRTLQVGEVHDDGSVTLVKPERPMNMRDVLMHTTGLPGGLFPGNPIDAAFDEARRRAQTGADARERHGAAGRAPAQVPPRDALELRALDRHRGPAGRDPLRPALRRVPPARALRAARHGRHRVLRPRGRRCPGWPPATSTARPTRPASWRARSPTRSCAPAPISRARAGWSRPPTTTSPSARCWPTAASSTAGGSSGARPWSS